MAKKKPVPSKPTAPTRGAAPAKPVDPALTAAQRRQLAENAAVRNAAVNRPKPAPTPVENTKTVGSAIRRLFTLADVAKVVDNAAEKR